MLRVRPLKTLFLILFAFQSVTQGQQSEGGATPPTPMPAPQASKAESDAARRRETFEIVWQTVKENHFDPNFGGVDWDAVRVEFAPRVAAAHTDRELHLLLQQMLNRLGQSHFNIIPPEAIPSTEPDEIDEGDAEDGMHPGEKPRPVGSVYMAEHMTYGIGIDLRVVGGAALVTRVEAGSSAERAGLRMGFVLRSIDGQTLASILRTLRRAAIYEPAARNQIPAEILVEYVNGSPGTSVRLAYLDARNRLRRASVPRERLRGELSPTFQSLPAQFVEFESRRLRDRVGYIRFNLFVAPVMDKFCAALRSMKDAPGIVIDLRGNRGGLLGLIYGMGGLLESRPVSFGVMRTRAGWHELVVIPQKNSFRGPLAVLIDAETQSAGEIFAGGLQESGRAVVVGERSAGATLPSAAKELPTGAILQYAFGDFVTSSGNLLEGRGVLPDLPVKLNRRQLLAGRDPQLEAALGTIETSVVAEATPAPPHTSITVSVGDGVANGGAVRQEGNAAEGENLSVRESGASNDNGASKESGTAKESGAAKKQTGIAPEVEPILERYAEAVGGRAAFDKLSTRVSKGRIEGAYAGMKVSGTVEVLEKSPDKYVSLVNVNGLGVIRRGFTGVYGYQQIPMLGFRQIEGGELEDLKLEARFGWAADLRRLYPSMVLKGRENVGGAEAYVVEATPAAGRPATLYFDARTGLLIRRDKTFFEDFREVDAVRLPFKIRDDFSVITLTEIKHNLPIDNALFAEEKNCFTQ
jgi:carboxyl-terminal processing protease